MRLLHAFGLSLVSSGAALSLTGLCATADAQPTHRAARAATIAEFAAPRREGYDNVIVQLPPLSPVRGGAPKPAEPAVTAAPAEPAVAAAAPMITTEAPASAPAAASPEMIREEAPAGVDAAPKEAEPPAAVADHVEEPAGSAEAPPFAAAPESEPVLSAPEALPAGEMRVAEPSPAAEPSEPLSAAAVPAPAEGTARDASPPESVPVPAPAPEETAPVVAQAAPPPPATAAEAGDDQDSGSWSWSVLTFIVAIVSLAGFAVARRRQTQRAAPPAAAAPAAPAAPEKNRARLATLVAAREKLASCLLALRQKLHNRKGRANEASASGVAEPAADWARIASTLRARAGSAVDPAPVPEAPRDDSNVVEAPKAESNRWEQDREEGLELLEPGSTSARALVMSARRKLQAVGER